MSLTQKTERAQHTPGPWQAVSMTAYTYVILDLDGDAVGTAVARSSYEPPDTPLANARLMAAAPDLLAALQRIATMRDLPIGDAQEEMSSRLYAAEIAAVAIAKAEGGAS